MVPEPLVDVTGARRRREQARLRRRLTLAGVVVAVLGLIGGGAWVVYGSPWLVATDVRVEGTTLLDADEVRAGAAVPLGEPLALVDTQAIEHRLIETQPAIESVSVGRDWPDAVRINVTERSPVLTLEVPGGWVWVAGDGTAFHRSDEQPEGVLTAHGSLDAEGVVQALAVVASTLPAEVRGQARDLRASSVDSVIITLADDRRIVWGSAEESELKGEVIVPLLQVTAREYDVSAPTHPTTR